MATVKKPHQVTIKPGTELYSIIDEIRTACATVTFAKKVRKAQSATVLEGLLSAVCEAADASTLNRIVENIAEAGKGDADRRGEFVAKIVECRNASAFASLPDNASDIDKLMKQLEARKAQLAKQPAKAA